MDEKTRRRLALDAETESRETLEAGAAKLCELYDEEAVGTCYEDNASQLTHFFDDTYADWLLVHGRPRLTRPPFRRYGHAWLEHGILVFDASTGKTLAKAVYYAAGQITDEERYTYTQAEARRMIVEHEHWGPWEGLEANEMSCAGESMMGLEPEEVDHG